MKNNLKLVGEKYDIRVELDGSTLFEKPNIGFWKYHHIVDGKLIVEHIKSFNDKYINLFLEDIDEQLSNGIDRNNLTINIPTIIEKVKIGNKIIEI